SHAVIAFVLLSWLMSSLYFFFSSRRRHTRSKRDWSSDVCSSDLPLQGMDRGSARLCLGSGGDGEGPRRPRQGGRSLSRCGPLHHHDHGAAVAPVPATDRGGPECCLTVIRRGPRAI